MQSKEDQTKSIQTLFELTFKNESIRAIRRSSNGINPNSIRTDFSIRTNFLNGINLYNPNKIKPNQSDSIRTDFSNRKNFLNGINPYYPKKFKPNQSELYPIRLLKPNQSVQSEEVQTESIRTLSELTFQSEQTS